MRGYKAYRFSDIPGVALENARISHPFRCTYLSISPLPRGSSIEFSKNERLEGLSSRISRCQRYHSPHFDELFSTSNFILFLSFEGVHIFLAKISRARTCIRGFLTQLQYAELSRHRRLAVPIAQFSTGESL